MPTLRHPDSDTPIEVDKAQVGLYEASGWAVVKDKPEPKVPKK